MKFKIVADSSCDLTKDYIKDDEVGFDIVPLTIDVGGVNFVDDDSLDRGALLNAINASSQAGKTSCPAPGFFAKTYDEAEYVFVVTISSKLSGTFSSAYMGSLESKSKVHVVDSKGTSGTMILLVDRLYKLIKEGKSFEKIKEEIEAYQKTLTLLFVLDKFDNLVKNGRMSRLVSIVATALFIKPLCWADDGQISVYEKPRTMKAALIRLVYNIGVMCKDFSGKCVITHCLNDENALFVKKMIEEKYNFKEVVIIPMRGLCSFYALEKGMIVSF